MKDHNWPVLIGMNVKASDGLVHRIVAAFEARSFGFYGGGATREACGRRRAGLDSVSDVPLTDEPVNCFGCITASSPAEKEQQ